ncbi:MAG: hypothetical protein QXH60_03200 [Candidatus Pacearchaeota archaeon]
MEKNKENEKRGRITYLDDIERKNRFRQREQLKSEITEDIGDVFNRVTGGTSKNKKTSWFAKILIGFGTIILILTAINLLLGNIWLLKFFTQEFSKTISTLFGR